MPLHELPVARKLSDRFGVPLPRAVAAGSGVYELRRSGEVEDPALARIAELQDSLAKFRY
jgi:hypothetical protein